ncbi:MAG: dUTP pyrophosphatase [Clostridiales bacterium]|nr:dUTP pyrophosphatase [Clostridiales bacterium]
MENIYFAKIKPEAKIPDKTPYNAGLDIYPCFDCDYFLIKPGETRLVPTGIASAIPENYYIQVEERGSSGSKGIKYSAGVIDSSYRGEWFLATTNTNNKSFIISKINLEALPASVKALIEDNFIIYPYEKALFQGVIHCVHNELGREEISIEDLRRIPSERGEGRLGSSGK